MRKSVFPVLAGAALVASPAYAQSLVFGDGSAKACYYDVKHGNPGRPDAIKTCQFALRSKDTMAHDIAATHVNLGILYMRSGQYKKARGHYEKAISLRPDLSESYINYAADLIYLGQPHKAIKAANKAIALGTEKKPEALYNRALAYDRLEKYDSAYRDLKKALELKPNWKPALKAIDNYEVVPVNKREG